LASVVHPHVIRQKDSVSDIDAELVCFSAVASSLAVNTSRGKQQIKKRSCIV